jgi:hypothetical protein
LSDCSVWFCSKRNCNNNQLIPKQSVFFFLLAFSWPDFLEVIFRSRKANKKNKWLKQKIQIWLKIFFNAIFPTSRLSLLTKRRYKREIKGNTLKEETLLNNISRLRV